MPEDEAVVFGLVVLEDFTVVAAAFGFADVVLADALVVLADDPFVAAKKILTFAGVGAAVHCHTPSIKAQANPSSASS